MFIILLYNNRQVGGFMLHLVIASGKNCDKYRIIKTGNYEELSSYTSKFNDSKEIRVNNKKVISKFFNDYNLIGDIVIMDDSKNNTRVRVLYRNDVKVIKELIKSQNFMQYLVKNNILLVSEYDYKAIMYYKNRDYLIHIKDYLKTKENFYTTARTILRGYEMYQKKHKELPSIYCMKKEIINKNKAKEKMKLCEQLESYDLDSSLKNEDLYREVSYSYSYGGYEEVFNDYSLDDLDNLDNNDFKKLVKSGYHR